MDDAKKVAELAQKLAMSKGIGGQPSGGWYEFAKMVVEFFPELVDYSDKVNRLSRENLALSFSSQAAMRNLVVERDRASGLEKQTEELRIELATKGGRLLQAECAIDHAKSSLSNKTVTRRERIKRAIRSLEAWDK